MIDESFVKAIQANALGAKVVQVGGRDLLVTRLADGNWQATGDEGPLVLPTPLAVSTLTGLCDYVDRNHDALMLDKCVVHVLDPTQVVLAGGLDVDDDFGQRPTYLKATASLPQLECLRGRYVDPETFIVGLLTGCVETGARDAVLKVVGSLSTSAVRNVDDDGITQTVEARQGIVRRAEVAIQNPVVLAPYRTFTEVLQPASPFVLRLRGGSPEKMPEVAVFEADGGAWRLEAIQSIAGWLRDKLGAKVGVIA